MDISTYQNCPGFAYANESASASQATSDHPVVNLSPKESEERRRKYLAQLDAQHQALMRQMAYEKQIRQQQVRQELEQRRKRYEQQGSC